MPELPDETVYVERLQALLRGGTLQSLRVCHPLLLRTTRPPLEEPERP